ELRNDRRHPFEMARPMFATEGQGKRAYVHARLRAGRVHFLDRGRENQVHARLAALREVRLEGARIARLDLVFSELRRVHENRDGDDSRLAHSPSRLRHQGEMPPVQRAHRGHERDAEVMGAGTVERSAEGLARFDYFEYCGHRATSWQRSLRIG